MTHLGFIAAAYGLALAVGVWLGVAAALRLGQARRRLAAWEQRAGDTGRRQRGGASAA